MIDGMRFLLADTETTGPTPQDRVCELAWVEVDESLQVINRVHSLIDPQMHISAAASGVHGITDEDVIYAPTMDEFFQEVLGDPLDQPITLCCHNVAFDRRYLAPHMPGLSVELCTLRLARRVWPEMENHKLPTLMYALKLTKGQSHRADGDVETLLDLLRRIIDTTGKTIADLASESMAPVWVEMMPFGKHKGKGIREVPKSYFSWLLEQGNLDRDLKWTIDQIMDGKA